jgi:hypothetical protein
VNGVEKESGLPDREASSPVIGVARDGRIVVSLLAKLRGRDSDLPFRDGYFMNREDAEWIYEELGRVLGKSELKAVRSFAQETLDKKWPAGDALRRIAQGTVR